jgi:hypothetical protein
MLMLAGLHPQAPKSAALEVVALLEMRDDDHRKWKGSRD